MRTVVKAGIGVGVAVVVGTAVAVVANARETRRGTRRHGGTLGGLIRDTASGVRDNVAGAAVVLGERGRQMLSFASPYAKAAKE